MKIFYSPVVVIVLFLVFSCNSKSEKKEEDLKKTSEKVVPELKLHIDSVEVSKFYENYPKLIKFQNEVLALYKEKKSTQLWLDNKGVVEFGNTLFNKYKGLEAEGLSANFPYNEKINSVFDNIAENKL
ncbi:hypothetical protein D3C86_1217590 [compost metagenome]